MALAGVEVEAHHAVGEQVRTGAMSTVIVACRHLGREIDPIGASSIVIGPHLPALPV